LEKNQRFRRDLITYNVDYLIKYCYNTDVAAIERTKMSIIYSIVNFCWRYILAVFNVLIKLGIVISAIGTIVLVAIFFMGFISLDDLWKGEVIFFSAGLIFGLANKILFDDL
jgi:hypothetical protein